MRARDPRDTREPPGQRVATRGSAHAVQLEALLTLPEVAELLRVSDQTVRRLARRGTLPHIRLGRQLRFDPADLRRYLEARKW